jgi:methylase of polypeptide subunit release factors
MNNASMLTWEEDGISHQAIWHTEGGTPMPKRVVVVDDTLAADDAYRMACEGTGLLWRGDFQNARQLLQAMARRTDRKPRKTPTENSEAFHFHRQAQSLRARVLSMLLIPINQDYQIELRRAPDLSAACLEVYGVAKADAVVALRELLGLVGAHEWRKKGVLIPALNAPIYPPVRGEYLQLIANTPLLSTESAFDIGTGTGVIAAILAKRGIKNIIATEQNPRALACATENIQRLGLTAQVKVLEQDMFPEGRASLIVCNPPWIPARAHTAIEHAIYDPDSRMLRHFIQGVGAHLTAKGEAWLILSNIAELFNLRSRESLLSLIAEAGLQVLARIDTRPNHARAADQDDPLYSFRKKEITSLWRLALA